jgi:hypothetical protein
MLIDVQHVGGSYAVLMPGDSFVLAGIGGSPASAHRNLTNARCDEQHADLLGEALDRDFGPRYTKRGHE